MTHPTIRKWLYGISCATTLLLGAYGLLDEQLIAAWNVVAAAVFGIAAINTKPQHTGKHVKVDEDVL